MDEQRFREALYWDTYNAALPFALAEGQRTNVRVAGMLETAHRIATDAAQLAHGTLTQIREQTT